tara:strand:- start:1068 stop:1319 length:252 start_codon:yes stop_codon:yes gene_type:complete
MKQTTKIKALKWLETAKSKDTFSINTIPHSKHQIEQLLGFPASIKEESPKLKDIKEEKHGDMGTKSDLRHTEESGDRISKGSE